jgi:hypothetical protein
VRIRTATTLVVVSAWLLACGEDATDPAPVPFNATAAELLEAAAAVDDASDRLGAALSDQAFANGLRPRLDSLATFIAANRADRAEPTLLAAQQALATSAGTAPAQDAPDRDAIGLALSHIERLLAR